jgi:hypothetical protein
MTPPSPWILLLMVTCSSSVVQSIEVAKEAVIANNPTPEENAFDDDFLYDFGRIAPRVSAVLSIIGSYIIIREVLVDHRLKRGKGITRMLLAIGFSDVIFSLGWLFLTHLWGDAENITTCNIQGFLVQFGLMASPLFNISLGFFFFLIVRYNWSDDRLRKLEPWIHACIWTFALAASILPIPLELYNAYDSTCWILTSATKPGRGENAPTYALAFTIFPVLTCVILSTVIMGMIYCHVRETEKRSRRYAGEFTTSTQTANRLEAVSRSRIVATQGMFYSGAFVLTYTLHAIVFLIEFYKNGESSRSMYYLSLFARLMLPLQGLFNCLVFVRNREMKTPEGRLFKRLLCDYCCCCYKAEIFRRLICCCKFPTSLFRDRRQHAKVDHPVHERESDVEREVRQEEVD